MAPKKAAETPPATSLLVVDVGAETTRAVLWPDMAAAAASAATPAAVPVVVPPMLTATVVVGSATAGQPPLCGPDALRQAAAIRGGGAKVRRALGPCGLLQDGEQLGHVLEAVLSGAGVRDEAATWVVVTVPHGSAASPSAPLFPEHCEQAVPAAAGGGPKGKGKEKRPRDDAAAPDVAAFHAASAVPAHWYDVLYRRLRFHSVTVVTAPFAALVGQAVCAAQPGAPVGRALQGGCGVVVDLGASGVTAVPYVGFEPVRDALRRCPVGGRALTHRLRDVVSLTQVNLGEEELLVEHVKRKVTTVCALQRGPVLGIPVATTAAHRAYQAVEAPLLRAGVPAGEMVAAPAAGIPQDLRPQQRVFILPGDEAGVGPLGRLAQPSDVLAGGVARSADVQLLKFTHEPSAVAELLFAPSLHGGAAAVLGAGAAGTLAASLRHSAIAATASTAAAALRESQTEAAPAAVKGRNLKAKEGDVGPTDEDRATAHAAAQAAALRVRAVAEAAGVTAALPGVAAVLASGSSAMGGEAAAAEHATLARAGAADAVAAAIDAALPPPLRPALWGNVIVRGGCGRIPGLLRRLDMELRVLAPAPAPDCPAAYDGLRWELSTTAAFAKPTKRHAAEALAKSLGKGRLFAAMAPRCDAAGVFDTAHVTDAVAAEQPALCGASASCVTVDLEALAALGALCAASAAGRVPAPLERAAAVVERQTVHRAAVGGAGAGVEAIAAALQHAA